MELTHRFTVPAPVEETWARFQDIGSLAECFPGAQVTSVEDDSFKGTVKVKLGPIALVYSGSGNFVAKDAKAHTFLVEAKGRDKRGNGTAGATVTVTMEAAGSGTAVEVQTDLAITGKPAQFGRGVMQDVSDKLLGQFVTCLENSIGNEQAPAPPAAVDDTAAAPVADDAEATSARDQTPPVVSAVPERSPSAAADDAIDLGGAVLPVLVKHYGKYAVGGLVAILVLTLLRRRRGR